MDNQFSVIPGDGTPGRPASGFATTASHSMAVGGDGFVVPVKRNASVLEQAIAMKNRLAKNARAFTVDQARSKKQKSFPTTPEAPTTRSRSKALRAAQPTPSDPRSTPQAGSSSSAQPMQTQQAGGDNQPPPLPTSMLGSHDPGGSSSDLDVDFTMPAGAQPEDDDEDDTYEEEAEEEAEEDIELHDEDGNDTDIEDLDADMEEHGGEQANPSEKEEKKEENEGSKPKPQNGGFFKLPTLPQAKPPPAASKPAGADIWKVPGGSLGNQTNSFGIFPPGPNVLIFEGSETGKYAGVGARVSGKVFLMLSPVHGNLVLDKDLSKRAQEFRVANGLDQGENMTDMVCRLNEIVLHKLSGTDDGGKRVLVPAKPRRAKGKRSNVGAYKEIIQKGFARFLLKIPLMELPVNEMLTQGNERGLTGGQNFGASFTLSRVLVNNIGETYHISNFPYKSCKSIPVSKLPAEKSVLLVLQEDVTPSYAAVFASQVQSGRIHAIVATHDCDKRFGVLKRMQSLLPNTLLRLSIVTVKGIRLELLLPFYDKELLLEVNTYMEVIYGAFSRSVEVPCTIDVAKWAGDINKKFPNAKAVQQVVQINQTWSNFN